MLEKTKKTRAFVLLALMLSLTLFGAVYSQGDSILLKHRERWYTFSNTYIYGVATGDLDNDGIDEIVTGGRYETGATSYAGERVRYGQIKIWSWNGTAIALRHTENWTILGDANPWWRGINAIEIDDVDNDGIKEIVTGGYCWEHIPVGPWMGTYENEVAIWNWNGTNLVQEYRHNWYYMKDNLLNDLWIDDIDDDSVKEIVTCGIWQNMTADPGNPSTWLTQAQINVWNWNGTIFTSEYNQTWGAPAPARVEPNSIVSCDVDNDAQVEILTGGYTKVGSAYTSQLRIWNYNGTTMELEHNEEWSTNGTRGVLSVFADDVTDDGNIEIVTGGFGNGTSHDSLKAWMWDGSNLMLFHDEQGDPPNGQYVYSFAHADADADGVDEFITFGHVNNETNWLAGLTMLEWNGTEMNFDHFEAWGNNTRGLDICIDDVDNDHINEIITAEWESDGIRWSSQLNIQYYEDTIAPNIETPIQDPPESTIDPGQAVKVSVEITDVQTGVKNVSLYYRLDGGSWMPVTMTHNGTSGLYEAVIPGQVPDTTVQYMIVAYDNAENQAVQNNDDAYYVYVTIPEFQHLILILMSTSLIAAILARTKKRSNTPIS